MNLNNYGWSPMWQNAFSRCPNTMLQPARVVSEHRGSYNVIAKSGERLAEVSGHFRHNAANRSDFPAVGDWVALEIPDEISRCQIHEILPRYSSFTRKSAGTVISKQIVAANVDIVFLVSGLDHDFNPRRIERYLTLAYDSGAEPVVVLNKVDIASDLEGARTITESISYGVPVLTVSAKTSIGLSNLWQHLQPGLTGALLGSSGVGKSSLINALLESELMKTRDVRVHDSHGRHTTTHRQLICLPNGSMLIDTPGMRELQLLADDTSLNRSFDDILQFTGQCRFNDCTHTNEPNCAVKEALDSGKLATERYNNYLKLRKEIMHHQTEQDVHLQKSERNRWKSIYKSMKHHHKKSYL